MDIYRDRSTGQYIDGEGNPLNPDTVNAYLEADKTGFTGALLSGAADFVRDTGQNIDQLIGTNMVDDNPAWDARMAAQAEVNPWGHGIGKLAPSMTPLGRSGMLAQMGKGGLFNTATGDPEQNPVERFAWGAGGEGVGDMAGRILGRIKAWGGFGPPQNPDDAVNMGKQYLETGGRVTPGQASGDQALKDIETFLRRSPGSGKVFEEMDNLNTENTNRLFLKALGIDDATRATDDVLARAEDQIGDKFETVMQQIGPMDLDEELADDLRLWIGRDSTNRRVIERVTGSTVPADGPINLTPEGVMEVRSILSEESANKGGAKLRHIIGMIDQIDNQIVHTAGEEGAQLYEQARNQWRLLKSVDKTGAIESGGNINPRSAFTKIRKWRDAAGDVRTFRQNVQAAASQDMGNPYGNPGTSYALKGWKDRALAYPQKWAAQAYMGSGGEAGALLGGQAPAFGIPGGMGRGLLAQDEEPVLAPYGDFERIR